MDRLLEAVAVEVEATILTRRLKCVLPRPSNNKRVVEQLLTELTRTEPGGDRTGVGE